MTNTKIRWIIGVMVLGLLGLVGSQLYWIDVVVKSNEEAFEKDVMDALEAVSLKLERQEALNVINNQLQVSASLSSGQFIHPGSASSNSNQSTYSDTIYGRNGFNIVFDLQVGSPFMSQEASAGGEPVSPYQKWQQEVEKLERKSEMFFDALQNMLTPQRNISGRFNPDHLDSLLKSELQNKGVKIDYDYGVISPRQNRFVHLSNLDAKQDLVESEFKASLFPNDLMADVSWLSVNFPGQEKFLRRKIWLTMASSGILILMVASVFGYSVLTILRQKQVSEMKNDFINNMTHELKTPIATISLATEALNDKDIQQLPEMRERYLKVIGEESMRLGEQVERVLQMAAMDKKDYNLKEEVLDLHQLIELSVDKSMIQIEKRGGSLKAIMDAKNAQVFGDKTHITNIILNLLDNANKYSPESPRITIRTRSNEKQVVLSVQDHGLGMSREAQKQVFQKFYRVSTGNIHNVKGFGLGLAYVRSMVDAHNGTIEVESELGKGSIFTITLPLHHG